MKKIWLLVLITCITLPLSALHLWPEYWWLYDADMEISPTKMVPASDSDITRMTDERYLLFEWDQQHVYYLEWQLPGISPQDLNILGEFFVGNDFIDGLDLQQAKATETVIQQLSQEIGRSGYYIYSASGLFFLREAPNAAPPLIKRLSKSTSLPQFIDTITFSLLKSDQAVYLDGKILEHVNPKGFDIACPHFDKLGRYYHSDEAIYYINPWGEANTLSTDREHFRCLPGGFALDRELVYLNGEIIPQADAKTFLVFDETQEYAKDQRHVYYRNVRIPQADANSFQVVAHHLSQRQIQLLKNTTTKNLPNEADIAIGYDQRAVYLEGERIQDLTPQELRLPNSQWSSPHSDFSQFVSN